MRLKQNNSKLKFMADLVKLDKFMSEQAWDLRGEDSELIIRKSRENLRGCCQMWVSPFFENFKDLHEMPVKFFPM